MNATIDTALDVTHDVLEVSVDLLEFVPIVGLEPAARTLLTIWDAVQLVDVSPSTICQPPRRDAYHFGVSAEPFGLSKVD